MMWGWVICAALALAMAACGFALGYAACRLWHMDTELWREGYDQGYKDAAPDDDLYSEGYEDGYRDGLNARD